MQMSTAPVSSVGVVQTLQVIHCDLASRNVLLAEGYVLKIGDFGMAWEATDGKQCYREDLAVSAIRSMLSSLHRLFMQWKHRL